MTMEAGTVDWARMPLYVETWRNYRNLTQRELAERSGLAVTTINEIETGKRRPRPSTLRRLASALGTEDWNLYNPAGDSFSLIAEFADTIRRLGRATLENQINGPGGRGAAYEWANLVANDGNDLDGLLFDATNALEGLIPYWLALNRWRAASLPKEEVQELQQISEGAFAHRVREWTQIGVPREVAEALLRAELRAFETPGSESYD
jgi:transcriptional regulator with XRE-family HTH domain